MMTEREIKLFAVVLYEYEYSMSAGENAAMGLTNESIDDIARLSGVVPDEAAGGMGERSERERIIEVMRAM